MSRHKTGYVISYHGILCHDYRGIPNTRVLILHNHLLWPHETKLGLDKQVIILNIFKYFDECVDIFFQLCTMSITYVTINELTHLHA